MKELNLKINKRTNKRKKYTNPNHPNGKRKLDKIRNEIIIIYTYDKTHINSLKTIRY